MTQKEGIFRVECMPGENFRDYDLLCIEREEFDTLEGAREEARRRLGDLDDWRYRRQGLSGMTPMATPTNVWRCRVAAGAREQLCDDPPPRNCGRYLPSRAKGLLKGRRGNTAHSNCNPLAAGPCAGRDAGPLRS